MPCGEQIGIESGEHKILLKYESKNDVQRQLFFYLNFLNLFLNKCNSHNYGTYRVHKEKKKTKQHEKKSNHSKLKIANALHVLLFRRRQISNDIGWILHRHGTIIAQPGNKMPTDTCLI